MVWYGVSGFREVQRITGWENIEEKRIIEVKYAFIEAVYRIISYGTMHAKSIQPSCNLLSNIGRVREKDEDLSFCKHVR